MTYILVSTALAIELTYDPALKLHRFTKFIESRILLYSCLHIQEKIHFVGVK